METAKRIILYFWLAIFGVVDVHALVLLSAENRTRDFFNLGYDAVGRANIGYDGPEKSSLAYDVATSRAHTDSEKRSVAQRATFASFGRLLAAKNVRPPSLTPPGAGRTGALREALRREGVPTSQQPSRVVPNLDRRGNAQPGRVYEYDVPAPGGGTRTVRIRDDAGGHNHGPGDPQNRGLHFNDKAGNHYDY